MMVRGGGRDGISRRGGSVSISAGRGSISRSIGCSSFSESLSSEDVAEVSELRTEGERDGGAEVEEEEEDDNEGEGDDDGDCVRVNFVDFVDFVFGGEGDAEVIRKGPLVFLFKAIIEETCPAPSRSDPILRPTPQYNSRYP